MCSSDLAISGATITSKAIGRGINDSAQKLLPRLLPQLAEVKREGAVK